MYNTDSDYVKFYFGEVVQNTTKTTNTYKRQSDSSDSNNLFCLTILVRENNNTINLQNVKPAFPNIKQIPIIGENVLVFRGYDFTTSVDKRTHQWYYFPPVGITSGINSNILPINSEIFTPDNNFIQRSSPILQPYRGDILLEGRFGNSLRFSSTIPTTDYDVQPTWTGKTVTDPIIILSNTTYTSTNRKYVVENIEQDASSLYLTSTQTVPMVLSNNLECFNSKFNGSQLIGSADRIMIRAKTDIIVLDSIEGIVLNTDGDVLIGSDSAEEPIPHGNVLIEIIQELINAITAGSTSPGGPCVTNGSAQLQTALAKLQSLNSTKYKIKKT